MTLFQMAASIAAADAAMILEGIDEETRGRVLDRLGKSIALVMADPPRPLTESSQEIGHG